MCGSGKEHDDVLGRCLAAQHRLDADQALATDHADVTGRTVLHHGQYRATPFSMK